MTYAIPPWDLTSVPVHGSTDRFPVRHVFCVGRNYAEHAKEMGGDASKEPPFFFTKAADSIVPVVPPAVGRIAYPLATKNFHHEIELVVAIGGRGACVAPERAWDLVWGFATGLDMTRRDLQSQMREIKRPWDIGKSFAGAAPIAPLHPIGTTGRLARGAITVDVNGVRRQTGDLADMIWDVPHLLAYLSQYYELMPGDLVFTGTPSGVGPVVPGDRLDGAIQGLSPLAVVIDPAVD
jgi:fumarylpyruvate hydrolase